MAVELTVEQQKALCELTGAEGCVFHSIREKPFRIYGLYHPEEEGRLHRMSPEVADPIGGSVKGQNYSTAGGRVRFSTDAPYMVVYCKNPRKAYFNNMTTMATTGVDVYLEYPNVGGRTPHSRYLRSVRPPESFAEGFSGRINFPAGKKLVTLFLPMYNAYEDLYIGLPEGATLAEGLPYVNKKPILFYGSSITQGASASRPGCAYTSIVSRRLNADIVNLGFSGGAKGEDEMIAYLAEQDMSIFVCDYDHNAPNAEHLRATHEKLFLAVREKHPSIPIVLISKPDFNQFGDSGRMRTADSASRRDVIIDTYRNARQRGDKLVWFIDGEGFFSGPDETDCTIDGTHPNDVGMLKMADTVHRVLLRILNEGPYLTKEEEEQ